MKLFFIFSWEKSLTLILKSEVKSSPAKCFAFEIQLLPIKKKGKNV